MQHKISTRTLVPKVAVQPAHAADAALRPKIGAILKDGFDPTAFPIYEGGAADGHSVGRPAVE
jgi:hypothetical protein